MPYQIAFDEPVRCYFVAWTGTVEADDLRAFYHDIADRTWFRPGLDGLHDFRAADLRITRPEVSAIADTLAMLERMFGKGRVANVVADDTVARALDGFGWAPERTRSVFTDYGGAKEWLELPEGYIGPFDPPAGASG